MSWNQHYYYGHTSTYHNRQLRAGRSAIFCKHCLAYWTHDNRKEYLKILDNIEQLRTQHAQ